MSERPCWLKGLCNYPTAALNVAGGGAYWPGRGLRAKAKKVAEAEAKAKAQQSRRRVRDGGGVGAGSAGTCRPFENLCSSW